MSQSVCNQSTTLLSFSLSRSAEMVFRLPVISLAILASSLEAYAGIGPVTDLHIVNKDIAPDGFKRPTVLAGGTFPGPVITGQKVMSISYY